MNIESISKVEWTIVEMSKDEALDILNDKL